MTTRTSSASSGSARTVERRIARPFPPGVLSPRSPRTRNHRRRDPASRPVNRLAGISLPPACALGDQQRRSRRAGTACGDSHRGDECRGATAAVIRVAASRPRVRPEWVVLRPSLTGQYGTFVGRVYSITSSSRSSSECGVVTPSALASLRLKTSSNRLACSTGRSRGWARLRKACQRNLQRNRTGQGCLDRGSSKHRPVQSRRTPRPLAGGVVCQDRRPAHGK